MKIKSMIKKTSKADAPGTEVERRGKFVILPTELLYKIKVRAAEDTHKSGDHVSETDVIQKALEAYLK